MKDEEMAEEYANKHTHYEVGRREGGIEYAKKVSDVTIQQAFLDGLKAGKPQWHEIESKVSPKREILKRYMPKNKEKVLLKYHFSGDDEIHISDGYYDAYDFEFHITNNPKYRIVCVIAWCELPTFE